mgnify:CR=1 FL=1
MTQTAIDYASELTSLTDAKELIAETWDILEAVPAVRAEFEDETASWFSKLFGGGKKEIGRAHV